MSAWGREEQLDREQMYSRVNEIIDEYVLESDHHGTPMSLHDFAMYMDGVLRTEQDQ